MATKVSKPLNPNDVDVKDEVDFADILPSGVALTSVGSVYEVSIQVNTDQIVGGVVGTYTRKIVVPVRDV